MECKFYVGQRVVCINADPPPEKSGVWFRGDLGLTLGQVYTIREVIPDISAIHPGFPEEPGVYLNEVVRGPCNSFWSNDETPFSHWRFKPIEEQDMDISVFTKLLNKVTEPV